MLFEEWWQNLNFKKLFMEKIINDWSEEWYECEKCKKSYDFFYFKERDINQKKVKWLLENQCPYCGSKKISKSILNKLPKKLVDFQNEWIETIEERNKLYPNNKLELKSYIQVGQNSNDTLDSCLFEIRWIFSYDSHYTWQYFHKWDTVMTHWKDNNKTILMSSFKSDLMRKSLFHF